MKKIKDSGQSISGINIAPVINIAFVLVIVMMMFAPIMSIPNLPVDLPEALTTESKEKNIAVSLTVTGKIAVDENVLGSWDELPAALNAKLKKTPNILVIVRADKDVLYSRVEHLIDVIKSRTKAQRIAVATKQRLQKL